MLKKMESYYNALTLIEMISWIVTGMVMVVVRVVEMNDITFRMVWSDVSRHYDVHSIIADLVQVVIGLM